LNYNNDFILPNYIEEFLNQIISVFKSDIELDINEEWEENKLLEFKDIINNILNNIIYTNLKLDS